jgi:DNA-binding CsgD family transcriptional regulator
VVRGEDRSDQAIPIPKFVGVVDGVVAPDMPQCNRESPVVRNVGAAVAEEEELIREAVNLWYGAGFGEVPWASALRATAELLGGGAAAVLGLDRRNMRVGRIRVHGLDQTVDEYVARMNRINPRVRASLKRPGPHIITDYRVLPETALDRSEFYDWIERHHGVRYFVGARVDDDGPHSLLASVEFTRRHGHPEDTTTKTFKRILPHIANAWRVSGLIGMLDDAKGLIEMLAGQRLCGMVGLRGDGSVLFMNAVAEDVIRSGDGLAVTDGFLQAARAANDRTLQEIIGRVLRFEPDAPPDGGGAVAVARPSGRTPFVLRVMPSAAGEAFQVGELPAALVLIADPDQRAAPSDATLRSLGFSPSEARVAQRLVQGRTLAEAARDLSMAHNTARAHLRNIFAKTRARSQVELVRMLCEFARLDGAG